MFLLLRIPLFCEKIFFIFSLLLLSKPLFCQDTIDKNLSTGGHFIKIQNFPVSIISISFSELNFSFDEDNEAIIFIGATNEGKNYALDTVKIDFPFNQSKHIESFFRNDTIYINSQMPFRAKQIIGSFIYSNGSFKLINSTIYDPNHKILETAEKYLSKGDIFKAVEYFDLILYPHEYIDPRNVALKILIKAHEKALSEYKKSRFSRSSKIIEKAFEYSGMYYIKEIDNSENEIANFDFESNGITKEKFVDILNDCGLILFKGNNFEESITINLTAIAIEPNSPKLYLHLGDAYFAQNKKSDGELAYKKYVSLMEEQGKGKNILKRVRDRLKK